MKKLVALVLSIVTLATVAGCASSQAHTARFDSRSSGPTERVLHERARI